MPSEARPGGRETDAHLELEHSGAAATGKTERDEQRLQFHGISPRCGLVNQPDHDGPPFLATRMKPGYLQFHEKRPNDEGPAGDDAARSGFPGRFAMFQTYRLASTR